MHAITISQGSQLSANARRASHARVASHTRVAPYARVASHARCSSQASVRAFEVTAALCAAPSSRMHGARRALAALALLLCAAAFAFGQASAQQSQEAARQAAQQTSQQQSQQAAPQSPRQVGALPVPTDDHEADGGALIVEGETTRDVFGMGRNVVVRGYVRHGVMAFGGDVVVEGRVDGDVAAVGGSVVQRDGSWIGGDVWVFGGAYRGCRSGRNPASSTVMFAGYEPELREAARNPLSMLAPRWTTTAVGVRVLSVLFWFIVSLALTAAAPGAVGRAAARLQLTSLRVAVIGFVGSLVISLGVPVSLYVLPPVLGTFVLALAALLYAVAYPFGRVAVHVATGRWLQHAIFREGNRSESVALLLGALFWALVLSVPYLWAFAFAALIVMSLGLALTARYRINWKSTTRA